MLRNLNITSYTIHMYFTYPIYLSIYIYIIKLNLADTFIQNDLQMRTMEAIKTNKRSMICKCYNNLSYLNVVHVARVFYIYYIINKKKINK